MASDIDIASNALISIGHTPINSFEDAGAGARVASALYEPRLLALLTDGTYWNFARKTRSLNRLSAEPINDWQFAFQLPTDMLAMERTYPRTDYQIFEEKLYSNNSEMMIDYIFRPSTPDMPAYFTLLLEYKMAADFAIPVTNDTQKAQIFAQAFDRQRGVAMATDAKNSPPVSIVDSPFVDVRLGNSSFRGSQA